MRKSQSGHPERCVYVDTTDLDINETFELLQLPNDCNSADTFYKLKRRHPSQDRRVILVETKSVGEKGSLLRRGSKVFLGWGGSRVAGSLEGRKIDPFDFAPAQRISIMNLCEGAVEETE